jgi:hypothetical protein
VPYFQYDDKSLLHLKQRFVHRPASQVHGRGRVEEEKMRDKKSSQRTERRNCLTPPPEGGTPNPPNPCPSVFIRGKSSLRSVRSLAATVCFFRVFGIFSG